MNKQTLIKILTDAGGKLWEKTTEYGDLSRVYFNAELITEFIGLSVKYYNSGNICGASLDRSSISHAEAYRILNGIGKTYYDFANGKFHWTANYGGYVSDYCKTLRQMLTEADTESIEISARLDAVTA